jgi:hypothetical protein
MIEDRDFNSWGRQRWDEPAESYQVEFWSRPGGPGSMWHADCTRLLAAPSVDEVIAWARERAEGRDITIWAEVNRGRDRGPVRLLGIDPTRAE